MFAKLCVLILSVGAVGCSLLAIRQQRLDAVSQATIAQKNMLLHGKDLARLRTEIAQLSTPQAIELAAAARFGPMVALGPEMEEVDGGDGTTVIVRANRQNERPRGGGGGAEARPRGR